MERCVRIGGRTPAIAASWVERPAVADRTTPARIGPPGCLDADDALAVAGNPSGRCWIRGRRGRCPTRTPATRSCQAVAAGTWSMPEDQVAAAAGRSICGIAP
jgi:hypothetical protein